MPEKEVKTTTSETVDDPSKDVDQGETDQTEPKYLDPAPADPIGDAKRKLEEAKNALADAEDSAKRGGEIEKAIAQYRSEQLRLEADEEAAKAQLREGLEDLKPSEPEKALVRQVWDDFKAERKALADSIATQEGQLKDKRDALAAVKKQLAAAKDGFEALKALGKGVQAKHRDSDALRKEAFDAIARQKRHLAYYLLEYRLEKTINGPPNPIELAEFVEGINLASKSVGELNAENRSLEADIKERETRLAADEKKLADLKKNFDASIRDTLAARA